MATGSSSRDICQEGVVKRPEKVSEDFLKLVLRRAVFIIDFLGLTLRRAV